VAFPVQRRFPCSPTSAAAARAFVAEAVAGLDLDFDALVLLTSELASNAVSHAGTAFDVIVDRTSDGVRSTMTSKGSPAVGSGSASSPPSPIVGAAMGRHRARPSGSSCRPR